MTVDIQPIGIIETPFKAVANMPVQPLAAKGIKGRIILNTIFTTGLKDLDGFTYITLVYYLHKVGDYKLRVIPFMDTEEHGIFATRSPKRPNRIGISTVHLIKIADNILDIEDVDMLDGTPLLDINPFFQEFDNRTDGREGWLEKRRDLDKSSVRSDGRFEEGQPG